MSSTIRFIAPAPQIAKSPVPGAANTKASTRPKRANTRTSIAVSRASLKRALSRGVRVTVRSTRAGRYNVAIVIPHFEARRLGLRKRSSKLRTDFVIGRVSGTKRVGTRTVRVKLTKRARYAIRHADRRIWFTTQVRYRRTGSKLPPVTMVRHNALQSNVR